MITRREALKNTLLSTAAIATSSTSFQKMFAEDRSQDLHKNSISCAFVGQSLIQRPIQSEDPHWIRIKNFISKKDVAFTNLECAILGSREHWPIKENSHGSAPNVLDSLRDIGFNMLSLSNNHAWDFGASGLLNTIDEVKSRGFAYAGTGAHLEDAEKAAYHLTHSGKVGMVAMAGGALQEESFAISSTKPVPRPGVNPLRAEMFLGLPTNELERFKNFQTLVAPHELPIQNPKNPGEFQLSKIALKPSSSVEVGRAINAEDRTRNLAQIRACAEQSKLVLVYFHNHYWGKTLESIESWIVDFAHECIDAGAHAFISHGVPVLQGIDMYRGRPIFYSLGNFIFHSRKARWADEKCWRSVVVEGEFSEGKWQKLNLNPIEIGPAERLEPPDKTAYTSYPLSASKEAGEEILARVAKLSEPFGTRIIARNGVGEIQLNG
jgi:poly-gamma-glutamate capsule biosynthesis protein CapA/YwtB (metallophosphatase superfamily)